MCVRPCPLGGGEGGGSHESVVSQKSELNVNSVCRVIIRDHHSHTQYHQYVVSAINQYIICVLCNSVMYVVCVCVCVCVCACVRACVFN